MAFIGKTRDPAFQYYADQTTLDLARRLRRKLTPSERKLWQSLRSNKITGFKFRRQHPVNYYIADFYCHQAKLVIEVDGPVHQQTDRREHDQQRDGVMENLGILVLRFSNDEVRYHLNHVLKKIMIVAFGRSIIK